MPTVLIADDDADIREATRLILEDAGYTVIDTPNGGAALDLLHTSQERLIVLLDMRMPDDGQSVIADIEQDALLAERHRYILFTATSEPSPPVAVNLQIPILRKPFDLDELFSAVARAAEKLKESG
jgi:two-component system, OmpR family, KDP operon response regulator KdpE